jgi:hypothetical protein
MTLGLASRFQRLLPALTTLCLAPIAGLLSVGHHRRPGSRQALDSGAVNIPLSCQAALARNQASCEEVGT